VGLTDGRSVPADDESTKEENENATQDHYTIASSVGGQIYLCKGMEMPAEEQKKLGNNTHVKQSPQALAALHHVWSTCRVKREASGLDSVYKRTEVLEQCRKQSEHELQTIENLQRKFS